MVKKTLTNPTISTKKRLSMIDQTILEGQAYLKGQGGSTNTKKIQGIKKQTSPQLSKTRSGCKIIPPNSYVKRKAPVSKKQADASKKSKAIKKKVKVATPVQKKAANPKVNNKSSPQNASVQTVPSNESSNVVNVVNVVAPAYVAPVSVISSSVVPSEEKKQIIQAIEPSLSEDSSKQKKDQKQNQEFKYIKKELKSCSTIASTVVVQQGSLGHQIIKKSLKGKVQIPSQAPSNKAKLERTKTGDKLAAGMIDIVFCCDTTSSMKVYLEQCKSTVNSIIEKIVEKTESEDISVKFGFVAYRDHPPEDVTYLTCSYDLTTAEEIQEFIESLNAFGGGDYPEAVMDGLHVSAKYMSWRESTHIPSLRYIFHIADAPPHGPEYRGEFFKYVDPCPCKLDINLVSHIINIKQIHYRFISTDEMAGTQKMADIFKSKMVNFECCSIKNAAEMDIKISDMIISELLPDSVIE